METLNLFSSLQFSYHVPSFKLADIILDNRDKDTFILYHPWSQTISEINYEKVLNICQ
ncbi:MAG: uncharacterized protein PWP49_162 [Thermococcaceae archaeon]|nr:MAG: Uncharacterized protein XD43_0211 [Thermococcales archaeon 44_46]MDK2782414.1 uncharacterized protein [Thermococcaceae archaeon]MDK2982721.1 uncharacterized protein [Thermococcaceae archaeon]MDN5319742.1 uncharacterized protein [Thermococcaceae archaeon]